MQLNFEQQQVFDRLKEFFQSDDQVFIIKGNAGTGKTTLVRTLVDYLCSLGKNCQLMAPTGRASLVLQQTTGQVATTIHRGIYDFSNLKLEKQENEDISDMQFKYVYPIRELDYLPICIVDEGSMIGNVPAYSELWKFGTSCLLDDLITYSRLDVGGKLVVIGDDCQLPPVNSAFSPALSSEFYQEKELRCVEGRLSTIMRQTGDTLILKNAQLARDAYNQDSYADFTFEKGEEMQELSPEELVQKYCELNPIPQMGNSVILCYSNKLANQYNAAIRSQILQEETYAIHDSDLLMVTSNHYDYSFKENEAPMDIMNGEMVQVVSISDKEEVHTTPVWSRENGERIKIHVDVHYRDVILRLADNRIWKGKVVTEPLLSQEKSQLTLDQSKAIYIDFCISHPNLFEKFKKNPADKEYKVALKEDPYFNALKVRFGYAITGHKSQGGEWDTVFIDYEGVGLDKNGIRWIYTATTRARRQIYATHLPSSTPLKKLEVASIYVSKKVIDDWPQKQVSSVITPLADPFHQASQPPFLLAKFQTIAQQIAGSSFSITNVQSLNYRERYTFSSPTEGGVTVDFIYNGKGLFRDPQVSHAALAELLQAPVSQTESYPPLEYEPSTSSFAYLFEKMQWSAELSDVQIVNVVEHLDKYQIIYCLQTSSDYAYIVFYFTKKGFITSATPHSTIERDEKLIQLLSFLQTL